MLLFSMVPDEQPTPIDGRTPRLSWRSWSRLLDRERVPGANKRSALGALVLAVGVAAATSAEGLVVGIPLVAVGTFLLADPLLGVHRPR